MAGWCSPKAAPARSLWFIFRSVRLCGDVLREACDEYRPAPLTHSVRLGHRLAHPAAGFHGWALQLHRGPRSPGLRAAPGDLLETLELLDQDLRDLLRHGGRIRRDHAVSVRHQLE